MSAERFYTDEEQVTRIWDRELVNETMSRHAYYYTNNRRREELETIWVKKRDFRETASLANNFGYYVGMEGIARFYVGEHHERQKANLEAFHAADPSIVCTEENLGYGAMEIHTANTPLIYIAGDGKTAQYMGYDFGCCVTARADAPAEEFMTFCMVRADLVKEDGEWRIWHLALTDDHVVTVGESYAKKPMRLKRGEDPHDAYLGEHHTLPKEVHDPFYGWEYLYYEMPKPYDSYEEKMGYGPNGRLGLKYYER